MIVLNANTLSPKTFLIKRVEKNPHIFRKNLISPKLNYKHNLHLYTLLTVRKSVQELSEKTWPMTASLALKGCVGQDSTRAFLLSPGSSVQCSLVSRWPLASPLIGPLQAWVVRRGWWVCPVVPCARPGVGCSSGARRGRAESLCVKTRSRPRWGCSPPAGRPARTLCPCYEGSFQDRRGGRGSLMVSAKKKDSMRLSNLWSLTSFTFCRTKKMSMFRECAGFSLNITQVFRCILKCNSETLTVAKPQFTRLILSIDSITSRPSCMNVGSPVALYRYMALLDQLCTNTNTHRVVTSVSFTSFIHINQTTLTANKTKQNRFYIIWEKK